MNLKMNEKFNLKNMKSKNEFRVEKNNFKNFKNEK